MQVESSFVIDGQMVIKANELKDLVIYETKDQETIFITSKESGEVLTRISIHCEMSQGTGFVDSIAYRNFEEE